MQRLKVSLLAFALAVASLGQSASQLRTDAVKRVGGKLACLCGTCKNTVADCPMIECHFSKPAKERISTLAASGMSDAGIIDVFLKEYGNQILAAPPAEGFNLLAWVMPWVAVGAGLAMIWFFMRRFRKPAAEVSPGESQILSRYQEQIEKDLAKLD